VFFLRPFSLCLGSSIPPPPPTPYSTFFSICTLRVQVLKHACHAFTTFELCYELKNISYGSYTLDPNFQVSLEKEHKTGKQGIF
jgi:hypothetical protein